MTLKEVNKTPSLCKRFKIGDESLRNAEYVGKLSKDLNIVLGEESNQQDETAMLFSLLGDTDAVVMVPDGAPMRIKDVVSLSRM